MSLFCCIVLISAGCHEGVKTRKIVYEAISDSFYRGDNRYQESFNQWKKVYEGCMNYQLFSNAFYMGLQGRIHIGSINNKTAQNINARTNILDTSFSKKFFDLIAFIGASNCFSKINVTKDLQNEFYSELKRILYQSNQYQYLYEYIDTTQILFKIRDFSDNTIRPDSLVSILQRTKDTSLLHFKELLLTPGNALLVHDAIIDGFDCEFSLIKKLSPTDEKKYADGVFFNFDNRNINGHIVNERGSIKLLANHHLKVSIYKYYTVFAEFYVFREVEN